MTTTLQPFSKIGFSESELSRLESNVENTFNPILLKEILDGRLIKDVVLVTGSTNKVEHGLQRAVVGYIVIKKNANSVVYDSEATNNMKESFLELLCSANTTVSLWVF